MTHNIKDVAKKTWQKRPGKKDLAKKTWQKRPGKNLEKRGRSKKTAWNMGRNRLACGHGIALG
jgi:hypothetical protein